MKSSFSSSSQIQGGNIKHGTTTLDTSTGKIMKYDAVSKSWKEHNPDEIKKIINPDFHG